jgi:hypothetical protein
VILNLYILGIINLYINISYENIKSERERKHYLFPRTSGVRRLDIVASPARYRDVTRVSRERKKRNKTPNRYYSAGP